MIFITKILLA